MKHQYSCWICFVFPDQPERGDRPGHGAGVRPAAHDRPEVALLPVPGELHHGGELHRHPPLLAALLPAARPLCRHGLPADAFPRRGAYRGVQGASPQPAVRAAEHGEAQRGQREARAGGRCAMVRP